MIGEDAARNQSYLRQRLKLRKDSNRLSYDERAINKSLVNEAREIFGICI